MRAKVTTPPKTLTRSATATGPLSMSPPQQAKNDRPDEPSTLTGRVTRMSYAEVPFAVKPLGRLLQSHRAVLGVADEQHPTPGSRRRVL